MEYVTLEKNFTDFSDAVDWAELQMQEMALDGYEMIGRNQVNLFDHEWVVTLSFRHEIEDDS